MKTYTFDTIAEWDNGAPMTANTLIESFGLDPKDFTVSFTDIGNCLEATVTPKNARADGALRYALNDADIYYDAD